jgi:hypothetical protein
MVWPKVTLLTVILRSMVIGSTVMNSMVQYDTVVFSTYGLGKTEQNVKLEYK